MLEWLKNILGDGYTEEIDKQVSDEISKAYAPRADLDSANEAKAAAEAQLADANKTIAGYKEHAAIVHYEATPETDAALRPEGFLLLDSGAQYLDGTTDITRTIALGPLTQEEKEDYTLILKGHIALATAVFPEGTRGAQLDVLARMPIWQRHMS